MTKNDPVDPRVRLAITQWPLDAPRGSVTTFCAEHDISRKTFYAIRSRARDEGQAAALEPRSRRPRTSPTKITDTTKQDALGVRAALESSGLDHGPISVHDKMVAVGMHPVPSIAALARIFRAEGVARLEPKKKPRASYRRFVYPAPNACWQLDATGYVLTCGRTCVIFQLEDDHSRLAVASHVAARETAADAVHVVTKGITARGVPQRLLTDNGLALNPSRRGWEGQLVAYLTSLGVEAITGKPYKPTTQGKNERFHQTLFRWLDKCPVSRKWQGFALGKVGCAGVGQAQVHVPGPVPGECLVGPDGVELGAEVLSVLDQVVDVVDLLPVKPLVLQRLERPLAHPVLPRSPDPGADMVQLWGVLDQGREGG